MLADATGTTRRTAPGCAGRTEKGARTAQVEYTVPMNLPMHGVDPTYLPAEPGTAVEALGAAMADAGAGRTVLGERLRAVVADHPTYLDGWARLAEWALAGDDPVAAYAFARVGYHRGLDRLRGSGWRGQGPVPWSHEPNRGFLRSLRALRDAAERIGEEPEAERCRTFLAELEPDTPASG